MIGVGEKFPAFDLQGVNQLNEFVKVSVNENYQPTKHEYTVIYFYPKDFTFVCPTELHSFQDKLSDFENKNTVVVACSTDTEKSHWGWLQVSKDDGGIKGVTYPIIADTNKTISKSYDVLKGDYFINENEELEADNEMICYRGLFLIDKNGIVQHQVVNNNFLGRNVNEALRMVDALTFNEENGEVCPANWEKGQKGMKETHESVSDYLSTL